MNSKSSLNAKGKINISPLQLAFLIITSVIATIDIFFPTYVAQEAERDSWISVIIGTTLASASIYIYILLALRYPNKTIIEYSSDILGKPLGKLVGIIFIFHFLEVAGSVNKDLGALYVTAFNPEAPNVLYHIIITIIAAYAVWMGIEVIARCNDILLPVGIAILGLVSMLQLPEIDFKSFLPVLYNGIKPPLRGSIIIYGIMLDAVAALQLIPYVKNKSKVSKYAIVSIYFVGASLLVGVLAMGLFGNLTGKLVFPALMFVRLTTIGDYIENIEMSIIGVWISGIFIKLSIFYYVIVKGIAQLINSKSYKAFIIPIGIIILVYSSLENARVPQFFYMSHYIHPIISIIITSFIPLVLLLISIVKNRNPKNKKSKDISQ